MMGGWMGGMMNGGTGMDWRGQPGASAAGATPQSWSMWDMMGQRLLLADARGSVIADSQGELVGKILPAQERARRRTDSCCRAAGWHGPCGVQYQQPRLAWPASSSAR